MPRLTRGQQFVSADGIVTGVRLEQAPGKTESGTWSWYDNPLAAYTQGVMRRIAALKDLPAPPIGPAVASSSPGF